MLPLQNYPYTYSKSSQATSANTENSKQITVTPHVISYTHQNIDTSRFRVKSVPARETATTSIYIRSISLMQAIAKTVLELEEYPPSWESVSRKLYQTISLGYSPKSLEITSKTYTKLSDISENLRKTVDESILLYFQKYKIHTNEHLVWLKVSSALCVDININICPLELKERYIQLIRIKCDKHLNLIQSKHITSPTTQTTAQVSSPTVSIPTRENPSTSKNSKSKRMKKNSNTAVASSKLPVLKSVTPKPVARQWFIDRFSYPKGQQNIKPSEQQSVLPTSQILSPKTYVSQPIAPLSDIPHNTTLENLTIETPLIPISPEDDFMTNFPEYSDDPNSIFSEFEPLFNSKYTTLMGSSSLDEVNLNE